MPTPKNQMLSDPEIERQIVEARDRYNAGAVLRLFVSGSPDPEMVLGDFTEASYPGYAEVDTTGDWTVPARDEAGVWSCQTEVYAFPVDEGEEGDLIHGYLLEIAGEVLLAELFTDEAGDPLPVQLSDEGQPFRLRVIYTQSTVPILKALICP